MFFYYDLPGPVVGRGFFIQQEAAIYQARQLLLDSLHPQAAANQMLSLNQ